MYVPDDDDNVGAIDVIFMSNGSRPITNYSSMYVSVEAYIAMDWFDIWEMRGADGVLFHQFRPVTGIEGWHHFVVTRTSGGHFYIYHNGTKVTDFVNNDVASSAYFEFSSLNAIGATIDNIVVNDTVWTPTTTESTTTPTPTTPDILYMLIAVGVGVAVIIVLAVVFLRRR